MAFVDFFIPLPKELREHPAVRTQPTTLRTKLNDTFFAFAGKLAIFIVEKEKSNHVFLAQNPRMGIFDYLTLGIPRLASLLGRGAEALEGYTILFWVSFVLFVVSNITLLPLRYSVAVTATIVVSPLVLVIHLFSSLVGSKQYNESLAIKNDRGQTIKKYLEQNDMSTDELRLTKIDAGTQGSTRTITLEFEKMQSRTPSSHQPFVVNLTQQQTSDGEFGELSQKQSLDALKKLNMFKTYSRLTACPVKVVVGQGAKPPHEDVARLNLLDDRIRDAIVPEVHLSPGAR